MKINQLTLRFYDNISHYLQHHKVKVIEGEIGKSHRVLVERQDGSQTHICNFYEYYVDDKPLIQWISGHFWNGRAFLFFDDYYGRLRFDRLLQQFDIRCFLLDYFSTIELQKLLQHYDPNQEKKWLEKSLLIEQESEQEEYTMFYTCECGDRDCGGIGGFISKDENYFYWEFEDDQQPLRFTFAKSQYKEALYAIVKG